MTDTNARDATKCDTTKGDTDMPDTVGAHTELHTAGTTDVVTADEMSAPLLGIDLVHLPTLQAMLDSPGAQTFLDEAWSTAEQQACSGRTASLAMTWAAKEATMKALGVGISDIPLLDIEVVRTPGRAPQLALRGAAAERATQLGCGTMSVSMSQDADTAVAAVIGYPAP
jgi:holo-[acyl-carrier protein] synthase